MMGETKSSAPAEKKEIAMKKIYAMARDNVRSAGITLCLMTLGSLSLQAQVNGSGKENYIPLWTGGTTLGNSKLFQNGGNVGVGTPSAAWALDVSGHVNSSSGYLIG